MIIMDKISVTVNGLKEMIPSGLTVNRLINYFQEGDFDLIVEINNRYIFPKKYDSVTVMPGDVIEFINPNLGG